VSDLKRLKELEAENTRLKKMHADLSLVHNALNRLIAKQ
jgi:putative transposase